MQTPERSNFLDSDSDSEPGTPRQTSLGPASPQDRPFRPSQTLLGSHNTLKELLAGTDPDLDPETPLPSKRRKHVPLLPLTLGLGLATTPVSRLRAAAALLALPEKWDTKPIRFTDLEDSQEKPPVQRRRPGRPPGSKNTKSTGRPPGRPRKNPLPASAQAPASTTASLALALSKRTLHKALDYYAVPSSREQTPDSPQRPLSQRQNFLDTHPSPEQVERPSQRRRASYSNRGKRVLSIGNGYVARPHSEVSETEFYKLLDPLMPEPNRMRQLLTWCFRKTLDAERGPDPPNDEGSDFAKGIAKVIKQELLNDLMDGLISTSWYNMKNKPVSIAPQPIMKPNPLNESNKENMEIFKRKLQLLNNEKSQWLKAYLASVRDIKSLTIEPADPSKLPEYLRHDSERHPNRKALVSAVVEDGILKDMQKAADSASKTVKQDLPVNVDKLYYTLYKLDRSLNLVSEIDRDLLNPKVARLARNFMSREPDNPVKDLLRGISRLDSPE